MSTGIRIDPFISDRIEHEHNPVLFIPEEIINWSRSSKPQIFEGPRGSGKSAILLMLSWKVTWNLSGIELKGSRKTKEILANPKHVGVFYPFEDMDISYWDLWKSRYGREPAQKIFGTYLDFLCLDLFLDSFHSIKKSTGTLFLNRDAEINIVNDLLMTAFPIAEKRPKLTDKTFLSLRSLFSEVHLGIRELIFLNATEQEILSSFPIIGPGDLIRALGDAFYKYYPDMNDWLLMPLFDDFHLLKDWMMVIVNSAVLKGRVPIVYKLTALSGTSITREVIKEDRTIGIHDLHPVPILGPSPTDNNYLNYVNGICKAKIEKHYGLDTANKFNFKNFFGAFDIEVLLAEKLKTSEQDSSHALLSDSTDNSSSTIKYHVTATWLRQKEVREDNFTSIGDKDTDYRKKRQIFSKYIKKWNHVAAVAICNEYKLKFPYCGWRVILHLSSGSIRDMLQILSSVWRISSLSVDDFVIQNPIDREVQARAARNVATRTYKMLDPKPVFHNINLPQLCHRLGLLFKRCQSIPYVFTAPETASIKINTTSIDDDLATTIRRAVLVGVLLKEDKDDHICIGLHPILSPRYNISFRSPFYYPESAIDSEKLMKFLKGDKKESNMIKKEILNNRYLRYQVRHHKDKLADHTSRKKKDLSGDQTLLPGFK